MLKKLTFVIFCILAGWSAAWADEQKISQSANEFTFNLYKQLNDAQPDANLFFSPYSIYNALGMTYAGATEDTKREFEKALHIIDDYDIHGSIKQLNGSLITDNPSFLDRAIRRLSKTPYQFSIANALWVKSGFPIESSFKETLAKYYNAESRNELSVDVINEWVAKKTSGKITDLLAPSDVNDATVTVLTNAAYFLGYWKKRFDEANTSDQTFYGFNKEQTLPLMHQTLETKYAETDRYQSVSLDYEDSSLAMAVILPKDPSKEAFGALEAKLSASFVSDILGTQLPQEVQLYLPRFEMKIPTRLKAPLKALGMHQSFTPQARFCGIYANCENDPIWIDDVVHQAFIKVDEAGTEAAAATAVMMVRESALATKLFRADRPFIYFIYDKNSGVILFLGRMVDPV
jgi:serpin B